MNLTLDRQKNKFPYSKFLETPNLFLLFGEVSDYNDLSLIIPKRAFESDRQVEIFRDILRQNTS
ncbi:MAG TPA: YcxB family protein [Oscillatoriales cyanobacterium M59_W2019_021]|nr:MAG: hypothetical protein D6728_08600 [Cyanobacteria bacterium J055]HIK33943.1 YcxB family protein [Oscillatoriales cyanobacterium M4454_W2019_049]HIK51650.1 YcxB family protein [Oscillatoriales cyanobacterium M59_W2019_021]